MSGSVLFSDVSFGWPDGEVVLSGLDATWTDGRIGLIGVNGSGKTTLVRLITGELTPTAGTVRTTGRIAVLPQTIATTDQQTVADLLGISGIRAGLDRVVAGVSTPEDLELTAEDWQVEDRALAALAEVGVPTTAPDVLDRSLTTLSGGEATMIGLAATRLRRADVTVLDEPTNNLDREARVRLFELVAGGWPGLVIIISHDRELLELVDGIAELREGRLRQFGGPLSAYTATLEVEQQAAERGVRDARTALRRERRQLVEARIALDRRQRYARTDYENKRRPKVIMKQRAREAQVSAGKYRQLHESKIDDAREDLDQAEAAVRDDATIRIDLPGTAVPARKLIAELPVGPDTVIIRGPERIALTGPNGVGKTTLLRRLLADEPAIPTGYLPQRMDLLDDRLTVLGNLAGATSATDNEIRARLARFGFTGDSTDRAAAGLSGGERFRATLALLLLAEPPPQLLIMDEPTNNLDLASADRLVEALAGYRGALIVASHDHDFCAAIGVTRRWALRREAARSGPGSGALIIDDRPVP